MEVLKCIQAWLAEYSGLSGILVDKTLSVPGSCGLYPLGQEQKKYIEDITGGVRAVCTAAFALRRKDLLGSDAAGWLLDLQDWVRQQSHAGLAPRLGHNTRVRAQKGKLVQSGGAGTATYEVQLIFEYEKE